MTPATAGCEADNLCDKTTLPDSCRKRVWDGLSPEPDKFYTISSNPVRESRKSTQDFSILAQNFQP